MPGGTGGRVEVSFSLVTRFGLVLSLGGSCGVRYAVGSSDCEIGTRRYRASKYAHGYPHTTQHEFRQGAPGRASAGSGLGPLRVAPAAVALGLELIFAMLLLVLLLVDGG